MSNRKNRKKMQARASALSKAAKQATGRSTTPPKKTRKPTKSVAPKVVAKKKPVKKSPSKPTTRTISAGATSSGPTYKVAETASKISKVARATGVVGGPLAMVGLAADVVANPGRRHPVYDNMVKAMEGTKQAKPQKNSIIKKSTASPTASYAPKGRSNEYISDATKTKVGRMAVEAERKSLQKPKTKGSLSGITPPTKPAMPKNQPKTGENVTTAKEAISPKDAKVAKPKIGRGTPKGRYGAAPKQSQTSIQPKGNTGVVGKFEDKIGGFMSKVFGSYSAASGVEGTDSYTVKKYKKGKRV